MAIEIRKEGIPLLITGTNQWVIWTLKGATTSAAFTSGAILSASTMSATSFSGSTTSAGGTDFSFTASGHWLASSGVAAVSAMSGDRMLQVTVSGVSWYVPAFSAIASA